MPRTTRHTPPTAPGGVTRTEEYQPNANQVIGGNLRVRGDLELVGAADQSIHGGGQRIFNANVGANITTASTSFVDIPGATGTFTVPSRPFVVEGQFPITIEEANRSAEVRIMAGSTMIAWTFAGPFPTAGATFTCQFKAHVPSLTWAPVANTEVTVRATLKTSIASSDASIIVDFAGPFNIAQLSAYTE